ncbi:MAG: 4-hydroxythreonine-4-phosphate dehydrogenase PdxA [Bacteroidetes bacterium]|nr:MAG: 4-hydroxythreonine-4-phosphate dehydrogenase PdxA [Bacteroidota bacterium]RLD79425.1 MAG: 4-hydroxythreonine-4-phosphate dehydrogenase PdxA [Bacteroidota bacterium]
MDIKYKGTSKRLKIGISQGDINGISYEVIIKSLMDNRLFDLFTPILYGSSKIVAYHRKALNISNFSMNNIKSPIDANHKRANIINCLDDNIRVELGKSTQMAGEASYKSLEKVIEDIKAGEIDILVTGPINKNNIQLKGFNFPGHTEYLRSKFEVDEVLMLMVSENLKVGVVTGHIPLKDVAEAITKEAILNKLRILNKSLIEDFAITNPKIAVLGLNPHAGDNGLIGQEEKEVIQPAIEEARDEKIMALGPYPADGLFGSDDYAKFDAVLAMYHDQGLAPFKSLVFSKGVNFTAGLPVVRTSPAHGTAYDIAGKNKATPESFRQALYLGVDVYNNRLKHKEMVKNQMKKQN